MPKKSQRQNLILRKRSRFYIWGKRPRGRERGQGTLEFILLIVVAISLLLGLSAQFFKPFKKYADFYLGDYISCLLDEGELPTLGKENSSVDCGSGPTDFANAAAAATAEAKAAGAAAAKSAANSKNSASSGAAGNGGSLVSNDNGKTFKSTRSSATDGSAPSENSTKDDGKSNKNSKYYRALGSGGDIVIEKKRVREFEFSQLSESTRAQVERQKASAASAIEVVVGRADQSKRLELKNVLRGTASMDVAEDQWSFGKIFRIVIIVLVLIALALVIGGQLNSIRKGSEK